MRTWRFIESPPADIFSQMALDRELFEEFIQHPESLPLLRIFRVKEPAVTIGRAWRGGVTGGARFSQRGTGRNASWCVRPTGGGRVDHGGDLIYSVVARSDSFPTFGRVRTSYLSFHEAIQDALLGLGIESRLYRCDEAKSRNRTARGSRGIPDCFQEPVATDILVGERKVAGGGQWRRREGFLHQGSVQLPARVSYERLREALRGAFERKFDAVWDNLSVTGRGLS